jgi:hypothetical protein
MLRRNNCNSRMGQKFSFIWYVAIIAWVASALASLAIAGLVIYILWRVAIHAW